MSKSKLHTHKLSHQSTPPELVSVQDSDEDMTELSENHPTEIKKQNYICCLYDNHAWIGLVEDVSEEHGDFFIKFMHPHGPSKLFFWPNTDDTRRVHEADILCIIGTPSLASSRRMYSLNRQDDVRIGRLWTNWVIDKF